MMTFISELNSIVWGVPMIVLLVGTGLYLTIRMNFIQIRGFKHAINVLCGKYDDPSDPGEISHFRALATALSATIGTGNIVGVAAAILIGIDPGATQSHRIDVLPRNQVVRARELRFEAKVNGLLEEHIRNAASRVARLVGSDAVMVLMDQQNDKLGNTVVATLYIQHLDKLSYQRPIDKNLKHMLGLVTDVARPTLLDGVRDAGPVPWYKKPWAIGIYVTSAHHTWSGRVIAMPRSR